MNIETGSGLEHVKVDSANEDSNYATSSGVVDYLDITKSDPIRTWKWGHDTYNR